MTALLSVNGVTKQFRGLLAVDGVTFDVDAGEIFAVIGPNGAGKTTLFNMIAGVLAPSAGSIAFAGERIEGLTSDKICRRGIGRTFQIVRPIPALTVEDNVIIGALLHRHDVDDAREHARDFLRRLDLYVKRHQIASSLTLPDRKRLELARALATDPKLLLLDEVMAGLRPMEVDVVVATLRELNRTTGLTILLIEHVMRAVMALATRVLVLHHGAAIAEGTPEAVVRNPAVIDSLSRRGGRRLMLSVENLDVYYGDAQALDNIAIEIEQGAIVTIVGANGAGKSSLIRTIAGMQQPARGRILYRGTDIAGWPSHKSLRPRDRPGCGGTAGIPDALGRRKSCDGRPAAASPCRAGTQSRACLCNVSGPGRAPASGGRNVFRRRAANARDRPLPDG